jgi:peptidoglycan/LPS O-acetylase OafA/YrhL
VGVDLFFVLSGFLVSGLVFRELDQTGHIDLGRFWVRRAFKILPSFWLYLGFLVAVAFWRDHQFPWGRLAAEVFFFQNYAEGLAGQTWSLAVEEHFYWILPLGLIWMYGKRRPGSPNGRWPWVCLGFCVLGIAARGATVLWYQNLNQAYTHRTHLYPSHLRMDSLVCGVMLRHWYEHAWGSWARWMDWMGNWGWVACVALLLPGVLFPLGTSPVFLTVGFVGNYLGFAVLISLLLRRGLPRDGNRGKCVRWFAQVGTCSYGIYLWHLEVLGRVEHYGIGKMPAGVLLLAGFAGSLCLGATVTYWVERPMLRLRDRWFPASGNR